MRPNLFWIIVDVCLLLTLPVIWAVGVLEVSVLVALIHNMMSETFVNFLLFAFKVLWFVMITVGYLWFLGAQLRKPNN